MHPKIDMIYYINLEHRTDRNKQILEQFEKYNITSFERVNAIRTPKGCIGCSLSHIKTLETFIKSPHETCIVLEDDFEFTMSREDCANTFNRFFHDMQDNWDIVMLSSNTKQWDSFNSYLVKCIRAFTTSGYMINKQFAKVLIENMKEGVNLLIHNTIPPLYALDVYWMKLQPVSRWYIFNPKMGKQSSGFSDIENIYVNYNC